MNELSFYISLFINRPDDFAVQRSNGLYARVGRPLLPCDPLPPYEIYRHLCGKQTIGTYVMDRCGYCSYAVFDADSENGLYTLRGVQSRLAQDGMASYLEQSRRGGHLWMFFTAPLLASQVRAWLLPYRPAGVELYPKQDEGKGYGSLIRLPLGVHLRSGKRYPFVTWTGEAFAPVAPSVRSSLEWFSTIERTEIPRTLDQTAPLSHETANKRAATAHHKKRSFSFPHSHTKQATSFSIREWNAQHDPFTVIGRYVQLDHNGVGCCPFGWHHRGGHDSHASFKVYAPGTPGGYCWYCHTWQQGGSIFDFLRYYHNKDTATLWHELREEVRR